MMHFSINNETEQESVPIPLLINQPPFTEVGIMTNSTNTSKEKNCQVEGCERGCYVKGYCQRHYWQIKKHGKTHGNPKRRKIGIPNKHRFEDGVCKIEICDRDGYFKADAIVDLEDYEKIKDMKFGICNGYVQTWGGIKLHRLILGLVPGDGKLVDHKKRNPLDNRRSKLRLCSHAENHYNMEKPKNNTSGFKGICWDKNRNKWLARLEVNGKRIHVGRFDSIADAIPEYNEAAKKHHGEFAVLNSI